MALAGGKKLSNALAKMPKGISSVSIGFLEGGAYVDGTSVPMIAAINEYGAPSRGQPPRPFFRTLIAERSKEWAKAAGDRLVENGYDVEKTLSDVGIAVQSQLQETIRDFKDPPLAPSTIKRKGFDKPLIDTSKMYNSVDYVVKKGS